MATIRDMDSWNDFVEWFDGNWFLPNISYSRGQWVDTDKFDITPKKSYREELIVQKEKELQNLEERKKALEEDVKRLKTG